MKGIYFGLFTAACVVSCSCSLISPEGSADLGSDSHQLETDTQVVFVHLDPIVDLVVLDDGHLGSVDNSGMIQVWDLKTSGLESTIETERSRIVALEQLADGRLVTASSQGLEIWDPSDPASESVVVGDGGPTHSVTILSDGLVAVGDGRSIVEIWDPNDLSGPVVVYDRHTHAGRFGALTYEVVELSNGMIASAAGGEVHVWDRANPDVTIASSGDLAPDYFSITELSDGRFASTSTNGWVYLWDLDDPDSAQLGYPEPGSLGGGGVIELADDTLVSMGAGAWVWSPSDPSVNVATYDYEAVTAMALLPDGRLTVGHWDGTIRLWDPH